MQRYRNLYIAALLIVTTAVIIFYNIWSARWKLTFTSYIKGFITHGITYDKQNHELRIKGYVNKAEGWVQFSVCSQEYGWPAMDSAIIITSGLSYLKRTLKLAGLEPSSPVLTGIKIFVQWQANGETRQVEMLDMLKGARQEKNLKLKDLVFLGTKARDEILEAEVRLGLCEAISCPFLPIEQEMIIMEFFRDSGLCGFELTPSSVPPKGTKVTVVLRVGA